MSVLLTLRERIAWVKVLVGQLRPRILQVVLEQLFVAFETGKRGKPILKCARRIKPDNIFVKEDLSPATLEKRESQRPKMEAAKRAGKIAYFVLDKLVIRDRPNVENG